MRVADDGSFRTRDTQEILDDKSHLEGMTERYARLGLIESETDDYDDEYDDTYDDGIVNVRDKDDNIDKELEKNENRLVTIVITLLRYHTEFCFSG